MSVGTEYHSAESGLFLPEYFSTRQVPANVWIGVTVESVSSKTRIDYLREIPATVHFLSCEPLLESLGNLNL